MRKKIVSKKVELYPFQSKRFQVMEGGEVVIEPFEIGRGDPVGPPTIIKGQRTNVVSGPQSGPGVKIREGEGGHFKGEGYFQVGVGESKSERWRSWWVSQWVYID